MQCKEAAIIISIIQPPQSCTATISHPLRTVAHFNCIFRVGSSLIVCIVILFMFAEQQLARPCLLIRVVPKLDMGSLMTAFSMNLGGRMHAK